MMSLLKHLLVLTLSLTFYKVNVSSLNWNGAGTHIMWSMNCDFPGNDLSQVSSNGENCGPKCDKTPDCTHFTWTDHNGGTCFMKKGKVTINDASALGKFSVCGICTNKVAPAPQEPVSNEPWADLFKSEEIFKQNWIQETGGHGWGNNELQYYTNNMQNVEIKNGLTITSRKENVNGKRFTSARLISRRKFRYGRFVMKAKLPSGRGIWPAFWLLAAKRPLNWPLDGEIDIMEHVGYEPNIIHATIHCNAYNHLKGTQVGTNTRVDDVYNKFHTYRLDWTSQSIQVFVDDKKYFQYNKPANADMNTWPFDNSFNIIINTAVGGDWGAALGLDESIFPQKYAIEYVTYEPL
jgi:beta-glucanase (GH16 family)